MATKTRPARYEVRPCALCLSVDGRYTECTTHPDAANPLAPCQDCGAVTCLDHRILDEADRCNACAAIFYATPKGVSCLTC